MWHSIEQLISEVAEQVRQLKEAIEIEQANMNLLDRAGIKYAGIWWKDGKYLYLVGASDGFGYRKREYIGADPVKVQAAMDSLKRGEMYLEAKRRRDWNSKVLSELQLDLTYTHRNGSKMVTATLVQDVPGCTNLDDKLNLVLN